jgi:hypothetical protein
MKVALTCVSGYLGQLILPLLDKHQGVDSILGLDIAPCPFDSPKCSFQAADITFERGSEWIECRLSEKEEKILALKGKNLPSARGKITVMYQFSPVTEAILFGGKNSMDG